MSDSLTPHAASFIPWIQLHQLVDGSFIVLENSRDTPEGRLIDMTWAFEPLTISGPINLKTLDANLVLYIHVPIIGQGRLGSVKGNLKDGNIGRFSLPFAIGTVKILIEKKFVRVTLSATLLGNAYGKTSLLFPLPAEGEDPVVPAQASA